MILLGRYIKGIASPDIPLGSIGVSDESLLRLPGLPDPGHYANVSIGGMTRFKVVRVSEVDNSKAKVLSRGNIWVMLNEDTDTEFDAHIKDSLLKYAPTGRAPSQPNMQQMPMPQDVKSKIGKLLQHKVEQSIMVGKASPGGTVDAILPDGTPVEFKTAPPPPPIPQPAPEPVYTPTTQGRSVVICESKEMEPDVFPEYVARMSDHTRQLLGLTWDSPWKVGGRRFILKPALRGDLAGLRWVPFGSVAVFIHPNSIPPGVTAVKLPNPGTTEHRLDDRVARAYLETILGRQLMDAVDLSIVKIGTKAAARIYFKTWSLGVSSDDMTDKAVEGALKDLRSSLVVARNKLDAAIGRVTPD